MDITNIIEKHSSQLGGLISILEDIQSLYGYLPKEALSTVSEATGQSLVDIYGVATFYKAFSLKPRGKHLVSACLGTACHVRGAQSVANELMNQLKIKPGETTKDGEFTLETVNCLGACALGPIVVIDGHYFSNVNQIKVKQILNKAKEGIDKIDVKKDQRVFPLEVCCPRCNHSLMDPSYLIDDHSSIKITVSFRRKHCWIRLSSLYGSFNVESEYEIPFDMIVNFFCPHCHAELKGSSNCFACDAPLVPMFVRGGGVIQVCSRRGCRTHMLDLHEFSL